MELIDGWVWNVKDAQWKKGFYYLDQYVEQEGDALVPKTYKTADGYNLGSWVSSQRLKKRILTEDQILKLDSLNGWVWNTLDAQ